MLMLDKNITLNTNLVNLVCQILTAQQAGNESEYKRLFDAAVDDILITKAEHDKRLYKNPPDPRSEYSTALAIRGLKDTLNFFTITVTPA